MERILPLAAGAERGLDELRYLFEFQVRRTIDAIVIEASRIAVADGRLVITTDDIRAAAFGREE